MPSLEILLFVYLITLPLYNKLCGNRTKHLVLTNKLSKIQCYQQTIVYLWLPTLLLLGVLAFDDLSFPMFKLAFGFTTAQLIALSILACLFLYMLISARSVAADHQKKQLVMQQMNDFQWLLPTEKKQLNWYLWGVSLSAGICEELLFRFFLLGFLTLHLSVPMAILVSVIVFGLCHSYQGWQNVIKTAITGLILTFVFLWTDSLIIAMLLHFAIDAYAGIIFYAATKNK